MPTFLEVRSMLLIEELRLNHTRLHPKESSSSPTILYAGNNRIILPQACGNFQRGHCQFGERCRFIHENNNTRGRNYNNSQQNRRDEGIPMWQ